MAACRHSDDYGTHCVVPYDYPWSFVRVCKCYSALMPSHLLFYTVVVFFCVYTFSF